MILFVSNLFQTEHGPLQVSAEGFGGQSTYTLGKGGLRVRMCCQLILQTRNITMNHDLGSRTFYSGFIMDGKGKGSAMI
jgi:hypothetical protein